MIGPADAGHEGGQRRALRRRARLLPKRTDGPPHERSRREIADERDEVAAIRIKEPDGPRIALAPARVGVVPDRLDAQHRIDALAALPAATRMREGANP